MIEAVLGTHIYPAQGAAADRMSRALDSWTALPGVRLVNLQFADDPAPVTHRSFETQAVLRQDSRTITGMEGPRKPIVREMLDRLVETAEGANCAYAGFSNADIIVSPAAIARVARGQRDAVIFSRMDVDPATGVPCGESLGGQDTLFIRPAVRSAIDYNPGLPPLEPNAPRDAKGSTFLDAITMGCGFHRC